jgi:hypothetical protein
MVLFPRIQIEIDLTKVPQFCYSFEKLEAKLTQEISRVITSLQTEIMEADILCKDLVNIVCNYLIKTHIQCKDYTICNVTLHDAPLVHTFGTFSRAGYMKQGGCNPNMKSTIHVPSFRMECKEKEDLYFVSYSQDRTIYMSFELHDATQKVIF